jgi:hypothetical protein
MPILLHPEHKRLLRFSAAVLEQAFALVAAHRHAGAPAYANPIGAHLRHVIEHYEALLQPQESGVADYDRRPRDLELQTNPCVAQARLHSLLRRFDDWSGTSLEASVQVRGRGGLAGDFGFGVSSSVGRELVFLASHAIHHYALLKPHCVQQGIPVSAEFGRAPSTVAHDSASPADRLAA